MTTTADGLGPPTPMRVFRFALRVRDRWPALFSPTLSLPRLALRSELWSPPDQHADGGWGWAGMAYGRACPRALAWHGVTTKARDRYLQAVGFSRVADENQTGPDQAERPDHAAVRDKDGKYSPTSHKEWLSADGEWERTKMDSSSVAANPSAGPHTLAGDVANTETKEDVDRLWVRYKQTQEQVDRDQLIVFYAPLVKFVAARVAAGLPQNVDQADLVSYGMFGLIDAITKFEPERGFKFETYAIARIKGAILDELRSIDWVPRSVRAKAKSVERAMAKLEAELHRSPSDAEIAEEMGVTARQLENIYKQISSLGLVALDEMLSFGGDSMTFGDTLADRQDGPGGAYERVEMRQMLAEALNRMGEREKLVLTLYYYENLTLAEIGQVLDVTESRVCQIHTKAVLHLRSRLQAAERISA